MDVSGEGTNHDGWPVTGARDEAIAAGVSINALPIVRDKRDVAAYYSRQVIGGESAFVTVAMDVTSFHTVALEKFVTEIAQVSSG